MYHRFKQLRSVLAASAFLTVLAVVLGFSTPAVAEGESLAGKTVRIVVNQEAGSTTDVITRQIAPYIEKYLPGSPTLIVENQPGGRGTLAASYLMNSAKPDGLTAGVLSVIPGRWALNADLPVDLSKFQAFGGRGSNSVMLVRGDEGYHSIEDMIKSKNPVIFGTAAPFSPNTILAGLFFNAVGVKYKPISGYRGQVKSLQALLSKEVNFVQLNTSVYLPKRESLLKDDIVAVLQWGKIGKDGKTEGSKKVGLETLESAWKRLAPGKVNSVEFQVFREIIKANGLFFLYALPPDTKPALVKAWSTAFEKANSDPKYLAMIEKSGADEPVTVEAADANERLKSFRPFFQRKDVAAVLKPFRPKKSR